MRNSIEIPIEQFETFASDLDHPECCAFDRDGNLWAGGEAGQIYRIDAAGNVQTVAHLGGFCAGLAFAPDDRALVVCVAGVGIMQVAKNGEHGLFASHAADHAIVAANYPVFDRQGRLYVSDSGRWMEQNGYLLRFTPDGRGEVLAGPFGYANGLALTADERHLFMVESDRESILRFRLEARGRLAEPEIYARDVGRLPDGLALDARGYLYVCCYASDEIWCIDMAGRKSLLAHDRWGIRLGRPTNLAFGGEDFNEIYVCNLGRRTITRAKTHAQGQRLVNLTGH